MLLYLKIKPGQRFNRIEGNKNEWVVRLNAPAMDGKANECLVDFLSEILSLPKSKIQLKKGHTSRFKCLEIDADAEIVDQCMQKASNNLHNTM